MATDSRDTFLSAAVRAVDSLLRHQQDDGSLGSERSDLAYYSKVPQLLLLTGHARAAHRMLDHVARSFQQPDGRFANSPTEKTQDPVLTEYEACLDTWLAIAAQRAGRFELARPAWAHLRRFANPGYGGFCLAGHYRGDGSDVVELLTTAQIGMTALFCGELPLALAAGHCLRRFWEQQPEPERRLLSHMDDAGDFIADWPEASPDGKPRHAGLLVGYPIAFLVMLANASGNSANLARAHVATAKAFAKFAERGADDLLADDRAHTVAWALGLLHRISGEAKYRELAHAIAHGLVARQSDAGTWQDAASELERFDQTAETALCLFELGSM